MAPHVGALHTGVGVTTLARADRVLVWRWRWRWRSTVATCSRPGHCSNAQVASVGCDWLDVQLVVAEVVFGIVEYLSSVLGTCERWMGVSRNDWCVVNEVYKSTSVFGKDGLLLGALDGCCKVLVVRLLKLLTSLYMVSLLLGRASL